MEVIEQYFTWQFIGMAFLVEISVLSAAFLTQVAGELLLIFFRRAQKRHGEKKDSKREEKK